MPVSGLWGGWFILDTGSVRSFVTAQAAGTLRPIGVHQDREGRFVVRRLSLGATSVPPIRFERLPEAYGRAVEAVGALGVIGLDLLSRYAIGLDIAHRTLRLMPRGDAQARASWFGKGPNHDAPLIEDDAGMFRTRIQIGRVTAPLLLDTGVSDTEVTPVLFDRIKEKTPLPSVSERFFDGLHTVRYASVPRLRREGVTFTGPFRIGGVTYDVHTGFVGLALLRRVRVLIDYPGRRIRFTGDRAGTPRNGATRPSGGPN